MKLVSMQIVKNRTRVDVISSGNDATDDQTPSKAAEPPKPAVRRRMRLSNVLAVNKASTVDVISSDPVTTM